MSKDITFFHQDKNDTNYAVQARLVEFDFVDIKVFDFEKEEVYLGFYDSDGGCARGDELDMYDQDVADEILKTVFEKLRGK